ncbi:MAG: hypothetical protein JNM38_02095 [Acidobacteria bacterium]|jgi:hypothetical protein|nr:hypothetical protein [Acidobacteriota bacterium]
MDVTYLLIICATASVLVLAALDAINARRAANSTHRRVVTDRRALSK